MLTKSEFKRHFNIIKNDANGNCLFESISYLINNLPKKKKKLCQKDIRLLVHDFYKKFDRDIKYPDGTIEQSILLGLIFENQDEDKNCVYISHDRNIINDMVWGSLIDILVCSVVLDVDINLYVYHGNDVRLEKIKFQYRNKHTLNLLYNGVNHFESLEQK